MSFQRPVVAVVQGFALVWTEIAFVVVSLEMLGDLLLIVEVASAEPAIWMVQLKAVLQELSAVQMLMQLGIRVQLHFAESESAEVKADITVVAAMGLGQVLEQPV